METRSKTTILFQGDSITDSGRNYKKDENLGTGYVALAALWYSAMYPEKKVKFFNRGIKGNGIRDLCKRWQKDTLNLRPDVISILIGINDTLGKYFWGRPTTVAEFENDYRTIIQQTHDNLNCKIVLMEPFSIIVNQDQLRLREDLNPKIEVVRKLSEEFGTLLIPLDKIFEEAVKKREPQFWTQDGIHPTPVGHALIAQSWLKAFTNKILL
jgi:lysophospholipase L1-like esterase